MINLTHPNDIIILNIVLENVCAKIEMLTQPTYQIAKFLYITFSVTGNIT